MKYSFATSMIAAIAVAQAPANETATTEPEFSYHDMFELTDDGRYALKQPHLPEISFVDNFDKVEQWKNDTRSAYEAIDQGWVDAWRAYEAAIQQPWNDFLTQAESIQRSNDQLDVQTTEDVVNFVADNTYVDGTSLNDAFPQVQEWLTAYSEEMSRQSEAFNLDQLRIRTAMRAMRKTNDGQVIFKRVPISLQAGESTYEGPSTYDDEYYPAEESQSDALEQLAGKIEDALISYGYDQAVVDEWFSTQGQNWESLNREQEIARGHLAQQQMQDASTYIKGILDRAVADLRAKDEANTEQFKRDVDAYVADFKVELDKSVKEGWDNIERYLNESHDQVQDVINQDVEEAVNSMSMKRAVLQSGFVPNEVQYDIITYDPQPTRLEKFADKVREALTSYGYDQATVDTWFEQNAADWESLHRDQEVARASLAQQQMQDASDYVKNILDTAVVDLRAKDEAATEQLKQDIDEHTAELKDELDAAVQEGWNSIEHALNDTHTQISDVIDQDVEQAVDEIMFASKSEQESSSSYVGFGILGVAAAIATGAYLYKKSDQKSNVKQETLLSEDTEFILV